MDFVLSKVAMSVCALLVASILSGVLGAGSMLREKDELDSILRSLSMTLERIVWSGCEIRSDWRVPIMSDGRIVEICIHDGVFTARAEGDRSSLMPACIVHTWTWNGTGLNQTSVCALDSQATPVAATSGTVFVISTMLVTFENQEMMFAFVSSAT